MYDWDRTDAHGAKRELHIDKALGVIDLQARATVFQAEATPTFEIAGGDSFLMPANIASDVLPSRGGMVVTTASR